MVLLLLTVIVGVLTVVPGRAKPLQGGVHLVLLAVVRVLVDPAVTPAGNRHPADCARAFASRAICVALAIGCSRPAGRRRAAPRDPDRVVLAPPEPGSDHTHGPDGAGATIGDGTTAVRRRLVARRRTAAAARRASPAT